MISIYKMEYENLRMPELKSLTRDRELRNYSRMRKTELVAFLTIWVGTIFRCADQRASDKTCVISQFSGTWSRPLDPFNGG